MNITVEKPVDIADGRHEGVILAVGYRSKPYEYTDVEIAMEGTTLTAGYPTRIMEESKLGQLMKRFGFMVQEGLMVDPDKLVGKQCEFITMKQPGKKGGVFANIIPDSVKPLSIFVQEPQQAQVPAQVRRVSINGQGKEPIPAKEPSTTTTNSSQ